MYNFTIYFPPEFSYSFFFILIVRELQISRMYAVEGKRKEIEIQNMPKTLRNE